MGLNVKDLLSEDLSLPARSMLKRIGLINLLSGFGGEGSIADSGK
jgi:hypothetical protein